MDNPNRIELTTVIGHLVCLPDELVSIRRPCQHVCSQWRKGEEAGERIFYVVVRLLKSNI